MSVASLQASRPDAIADDLPSAMSDEDLLLEYRLTGNTQLFAELVVRYERELFGYLQRYVGDAAAAEDIFQLTFLQLHLKCDAFDESRTFRPWLYKIATNLAIDTIRRSRRHRTVRIDWQHRADDNQGATVLSTLAGTEPAPTYGLEQDEQRQWVNNAVESLPEHLRRPVRLVFFQGLKYREAAEVLSLPVGTLKSRMHTALEKLKNYSPHCPRPSPARHCRRRNGRHETCALDARMVQRKALE